MYYPNGIRYPEMEITEMTSAPEEEDDVLDLCVRKQESERVKDKYDRDVNGNGYVEHSHSFYGEYNMQEKAVDYKCKSPEILPQQRYVQSTGPRSDSGPSPTEVILQQKMYGDERVHPSPNRTPPNNCPSFVSESSVGSPFIPLAPAISPMATRNGKPTRPFKAYPKEFLPLATSEGLLDDSNKRYMEFRRQFLAQLHATAALTSNKNMKRPVQSDSPNQLPSSSGDAKDKAYWERRKKNNEAAKKSRDARRAKEDEIAIRAAFLERENVRLKLELASLRSETDRLRCMLYSS